MAANRTKRGALKNRRLAVRTGAGLTRRRRARLSSGASLFIEIIVMGAAVGKFCSLAGAPTELDVAAHARTGRDGERVRFQIADQLRRLQQLYLTAGDHVAF